MADPIRLSDGGTTLDLPADLEWVDEYDWQPVTQEAGYTLSGALVLETAAKLAGRPITLVGDADRCWLARAQLAALDAWASVPGQTLTLTLRGVARQVVYRHQDAPVVEARQVVAGAAPDTPGGGTYAGVALKFMEI